MEPDPPPPGPEEPATLAPSAMVQAANQLVRDLFNTVAARLPEMVRAQAPPDSPIPEFTDKMIEQLQAQLNRALGVTPEDGAPPAEPPP